MRPDTAEIPRLPFDRPAVLDIGPVWADLRARHPVSRVLTPAGDPAWLVTGYAEAKALFSDPRLGRSHRRPGEASRISNSGFNGGPVGDFDAEPAFNACLRRVLVPSLSARRMRRLEDEVQTLTDSLVDRMIAEGGDGKVVDLHQHLSLPLPIFVICQLLGVPYSHRDHFKDLSERSATMTGDDPLSGVVELFTYAAELAEVKKREPGEDVITDLVQAQRDDPDFTDSQLAMVVAGVLFAGHETTVNRISIGTLLLLENPETRRRLVEDADSRAPIVEEVLRLAAPEGFGLARYAREDITIGEVTIASGDAVIISTLAGNRDEWVFPDPEALDPERRTGAPHLSFGHGAHYCIGASLARVELKIALTTLFARVPDLRLAVDVGQLSLHTERLTGGLHDLPVTW
ncbi:cytochrome P450 [Lentzea pudingi]|uniref:Cytochrome P450 n=1 Tax=Lentzea pudingi TaxID=1789439 RepID=A0ABQ2HX64_9PSEU|nr:cytochrome P450 [Lentzea pudingi]GGM94263.1 cytochrome P450 [Lentzea pudingi]